jgi:hypothetical protein
MAERVGILPLGHLQAVLAPAVRKPPTARWPTPCAVPDWFATTAAADSIG